MQNETDKLIRIRGAKTHNLQNVSLDIPRDRLIVVTGLSGSGKSSLAFDTIYAEGQRKYVESLSAYARQFLGQMIKPDVEHIEGLPPTIAIAQQTGRAGPRSTVGTITEIYDYLRLLFARVGTPHCPRCGKRAGRQTLTQIVDGVMGLAEGTKILVLAPLLREKKGDPKEILERAVREGFVRVRVDGDVHEVKAVPVVDPKKAHSIEAVVDRLIIRNDMRTRLVESIETALRVGDGVVIVSHEHGGTASSSGTRKDSAPWNDSIYTTRYACTKCGIGLPELEPALFSFNSPQGACATCDGLGRVLEFDPALVIPDEKMALEEGAIAPWRRGKGLGSVGGRLLNQFCEMFKVSPRSGFGSLPQQMKEILLGGTSASDEAKFKAQFEGVIPHLKRRWRESDSDSLKEWLQQFMLQRECESCHGARLRLESLAVWINGLNIDNVVRMSIHAASGLFDAMQLEGEAGVIAQPILQEIRRRLKFIVDVGIGYLTLGRRAQTLSGGEGQRIRLATQVGSGLVSVCYVLDEPTVGLHQRDTTRLISTLVDLRQMGNTVMVVEHDRDVMEAGEWFIDIGPEAGARGGRVLVNGPREQLISSAESITAKYLRGELEIARPQRRREVSSGQFIEIKGAAENNLKKIDVRFPLGVFCCVTGVSGSGKSTLVNQILLPAMRAKLNGSREVPGKHDKITGMNRIDKVIQIDQSGISRSPRSNPATYTGVFNHLRVLFAKTREAKVRGYDSTRFSFNARGGRCEACRGQGTRRIEMHFLPDIFVECAECRGTRYSRETLEIHYRGKTIADVLAMSIEEALAFFENIPAIKQMLQALVDVGLGYMSLGQPAAFISGGEAQRIKLAAELGKSAIGHTLYVMDEPTTGLHFADIHRLVEVLNRLCDAGHSLIVIEHNLDVIMQADWIIDLGPEGGEAGGRIVAEGTPEDVAEIAASYTGRYLKRVMARI
jgi:excinuclease ABC subunit A